MRERPSSRLIVLDEHNHILLFEFVFTDKSDTIRRFWATPGGAVDDGETFEAAAVRELYEETGIKIDAVGSHVAERQFVLQLFDGESVQAIERYFVVRNQEALLSYDNHTLEERQFITQHKWWHVDELAKTTDTYFPVDLIEIVKDLSS